MTKMNKMHKPRLIWYYDNKIVEIDTNMCMSNISYKLNTETINLVLITDEWIDKFLGRSFPKYIMERFMK